MNNRGKESDHLTELVKELVAAEPHEAMKKSMDEILQKFRAELHDHPYVRKLERKAEGRALMPVLTAGRLAPARIVAAAFAVLLIVVGGITLLRPRIVPVVWAEVADQVADIDRFMFQMKIGIQGEKRGRGESIEKGRGPVEEATMTFYLSSRFGLRWDVYSDSLLAMSWYIPPGGDSMVVVNHEEKVWVRLPVEKKEPGQSPLSPDEDPEEYIKRFLARGYQELGRTTIDGVPVEGIEVIDPPAGIGSYLDGVGRLWVDVRNSLPMRLELEGRQNGQQVSWLLDFRWGEQVDVEAFSPVIPSGFSAPPPEEGS